MKRRNFLALLIPAMLFACEPDSDDSQEQVPPDENDDIWPYGGPEDKQPSEPPLPT